MAGDAVIAAKDGVADGARAMERTAQFVESAAELVEDVAQNVVDATRSRPSAVEYEGNPGETIRVETQIPTLESDIFSSEVPIHVNPERLKEVAVSRLQQAIIQAHADPSFRTALRTILILVRKYINKVRSTTDRLSDAQMPDFQPILWADPPLVNALSQLSTLLSRMASNRAMEPVLRAFHALVVDLADIPNALVSDIHSQNSQTFFAFLDSLGLWFDRALSDPQFVLSEEGKRNLDGLYDRARNLVDEASHSDMDWIRHLRMLLHEINLFASALMEDKTTHRLLDALTTLSSSLSSFTQTAVIAAPGKLDAAKQKVRADLQRDLLRWLLPRLLRALHAIPMPRIEYRSTGSNLDAAIDTLYLTPSSAQASLVPDHVRICNWTELHLNVAEVNPQTDTIIPAYALPHGGMKTYSRVRVSVDGVRLSARDVGYYVCWKAFRSEWLNWLGYEDEGLVSVDIGGRGAKGQGLSFEFELAIAPDSDDQEADNVDSLFSVSNVHVSVPGLRFSLDRSKHWLLNKLLLQPLGGSIGQAAVGWVLRRQLEAALDGLGRIGADVRKEALKSTREARKDVEWSDYGSAIWKVVAELNHEENEEGETRDETPVTETHTSATTKGIIRTTVTYPAAAENTSPRSSPLTPVDESTITLGVGAQILPGKGGPHDANPGEDGDQDRPQNIAREALDQVQARVEDVVETGEHIVQRTKDVGNEVEGARERERAAEGAESRKEGWRSHAFDAGR
ncbi:hypothetical protein PHLCEN_2v3360 [Hermanssonia centrifuga]|uniref:HAM1-like N-terminal domain-containing protein n=1 Tax=Hermanssonia centrifuga TaxID=98765 RepID=A0A2R6QM34_9APHY|nr:hypothetical protein PHLCEN_2v3360 [Hermanssonia centrifuga]